MNYRIPKHESKLKEKSIKVIGPKVWAGLPNEAKMLPFRKSFTKYLKKIYIESLPTKMSQGKHYIPKPLNSVDNKRHELANLFLEETLEEEFLGFETPLE